MEEVKKIGFLMNPYAGIGGKAGLKGSDNLEKVRELLGHGYEKTAEKRAEICMRQLPEMSGYQLISASGEMGENLLKRLHLPCQVIPCSAITTREDTCRCAGMMKKSGVELLVFCGGDGTARDICEAVGSKLPVLGIPAGVKMYSACYAKNPFQAGELLVGWLSGKEISCELREVLDIEESDLDNRGVSPKLYGFLNVPNDGIHIQKAKEVYAGTGEETDCVAKAAVGRMKKDWIYVIGPGGTTWKIKELLYENRKNQDPQKEVIHGTVRGVDVVKNGEIVFRDVSEKTLWKLVCEHKNVKILVTCIGGNGFLFGRGNQQISPRIIRKIGREQIEIIVTKEKLAGLGGEPMHVDTGDVDTDQYLRGYYKIIFHDAESAIYRVE